jgi:hypothetical protein
MEGECLMNDFKVMNDVYDVYDVYIGVYAPTKTKELPNFLSSDLSKNQHKNTPIYPQVNVINVINVIKKRTRLFASLINLCPDFYVWTENSNEKWQPVQNYNFDDLANNIKLHREILPQEVVFDIDGDGWNDVKILATQLLQRLERLNIPYLLYSSGGKGLHIHVFVDDSQIVKISNTIIDKCLFLYLKQQSKTQITVKDLAQATSKLFKAGMLFLFEDLNQNNAHIDTNKFLQDRCLIRAEGSINLKTLGYKTLLDNIPEQRIIIRDRNEIKLPDDIPLWKPEPSIFDKIILAGFKKLSNNQSITTNIKVKPKRKTKQISRAYSYVENFMRITIPDGRHRAVDLIILPYLLNILHYDLDTAVSVTYDWVQKCNELKPTTVNHTYIINKARYVLNKRLLPLSKARALELLMEVHPAAIQQIPELAAMKDTSVKALGG